MVVPILANAFGGRVSVGLLLPILIFADIMAVAWYNRHADWKHVLKLIPWAMAGIIVATLVGKNISDLGGGGGAGGDSTESWPSLLYPESSC